MSSNPGSAGPAGDSRRLDTVQISVAGRPLGSQLYPLLRSVRVEESVQLPDTFTMRFDDPHFELFDSGVFALGAPVQIAFRSDGDPLVVTEGEVTAIGVEPGSTGRHEVTVHGLDRAHRLAQAPRSRTFQNMSDAAIVQQIAGEYGLTAQVEGSGARDPHVFQVNQTDYAFLRERAARIGFDLWIVGETLHFAPRPGAASSPPTLRWGANLHAFRVRFSAAERCDEVVVRGWDGVGKQSVTGRSTEPDPGSDAPAVAQMAQAARAAFGRRVRQSADSGVTTQAQADALAASLMARASGAEVALRGEAAGDPRIAAGATVRLEGVGQQLAGSYRLSSVEHTFGSDQPYRTRFVSGAKDPAGLVDLVGGGEAGATAAPSAGSGGGSAVRHLVAAEVTNNDDPEGLGRVRLRFPALSDQDESTWARVATPGAGPSRGLQLLPEVGDEVLVGFEWGDVARPVVLGGLWNRTDPPPAPRPTDGGRTETRVLATRADHRLELVDGPTASARLALGGTECALHLQQDASSLTGEEKLAVSARTVEITATEKLVLSAPQIEIAADGGLTATGKPIKLN